MAIIGVYSGERGSQIDGGVGSDAPQLACSVVPGGGVGSDIPIKRSESRRIVSEEQALSAFLQRDVGYPSRRNIHDHRDALHRLALIIEYEVPKHAHPYRRPIFSDVSLFDRVVRHLSREHELRSALVRVKIIRVSDLLPGELRELLCRITDDIAEAAVHVFETAIDGVLSNAYGTTLEKRLEAALAVGECRLDS